MSGKKVKELKLVKDPVCSEEAAGNTETLVVGIEDFISGRAA